MRREKESQREQEMEVDWGGERLHETESENKKAWQTEEGEKDCSELGGGVGTEADTVDVLVELTERSFFFFFSLHFIANLLHWHPDTVTCESNPRLWCTSSSFSHPIAYIYTYIYFHIFLPFFLARQLSCIKSAAAKPKGLAAILCQCQVLN